MKIIRIQRTVSTTPARKPVKKALVIGINYSEAATAAIVPTAPTSPAPTTPTSPTTPTAPTSLSDTEPDSDTSTVVDTANDTLGQLQFAERDAVDFRDLLITKYGYRKDDTVLMTESAEDAKLRPTRKNILAQIHQLVKGAEKDDRFVFFYSGHTDQEETDSINEDDGFDEVLLPLDYHRPDGGPRKIIRDNDLRRLLVDPLPAGASLLAIFDSCHSGTLLDLDHYLCNNVYFPWLHHGNRKWLTQWNNVRRRCAAHGSKMGVVVIEKDAKKSQDSWLLRDNQPPQDSQSPQDANKAVGVNPTAEDAKAVSPAKHAPGVRIYQRKRLSEDEYLTFNTAVKAVGAGEKGEPREFSIVTRSYSMQVGGKHDPPERLARGQTFNAFQYWKSKLPPRRKLSLNLFGDGLVRTASPDPYAEIRCRSDGFGCRPGDGDPASANVVSISACTDNSRAWETKKTSMTQSLIRVLDKERNPPLQKLVQKLGHAMYANGRSLHRWSRQQVDSARIKGAPLEKQPSLDVELVNFATPQLGGQHTLDAGARFDP